MKSFSPAEVITANWPPKELAVLNASEYDFLPES